MVIIRIWEGLGNQMFQYAYARALKEQGIDTRLDIDKAYDNIFIKYRNHDQRNNSIQNFNISLPSIDVYKYGKYEYLKQNTVLRKFLFWLGSHFLWKYNFYEEVSPEYSMKAAGIKKNCYVKGWFQSERYFKNIRSILIKEFVPREKIKISTELKKAIESAESVSIHIRRGDYVKINHAINITYYKMAIEYIKKAYKYPYFLIFSDDLDWVKKNLQINDKFIYVNENKILKDYEELFIMSKCQSNIISNSTFSWWAAWLNKNDKKIVIAPKQWMKVQRHIIPEDWVIL